MNGISRHQEQEQEKSVTATRITSTSTKHSSTNSKGTTNKGTTSTELAPKASSTTTTITTTTRVVNGVPSSSVQSHSEHHTTKMHHAEQAFAQHDNLKVAVKGTADASASKTANQSRRVVVQSDGAIVSSGQSTRSSTVKYAVEASSVQEKIIRYGTAATVASRSDPLVLCVFSRTELGEPALQLPCIHY